MFKYMINNMRTFMLVTGFFCVLVFSATNSTKADTKVDMHVVQPGTTNWGQWQCDPAGSAADDFLRWPDATAQVQIKQQDDKTHLKIKIHNAAPDKLWTVWFIHAAIGVHPLRNGFSPVTAMANPSEIAELIGGTPHENLILSLDDFGDRSGTGQGNHAGFPNAPNAFFTDSNGNGKFDKVLDFPVIKGAYPYQETAFFIKDAFGVDVTGMQPAPNTVIPNIARIAIVSHCVDDAAHGLESYTDERWFQLRVNPFEVDGDIDSDDDSDSD